MYSFTFDGEKTNVETPNEELSCKFNDNWQKSTRNRSVSRMLASQIYEKEIGKR